MSQNSLMPSIPGYKLIAEIGRGASGVVYLAYDSGLDRNVALKLFPALWRDMRREIEGVRDYKKLADGHEHIIQIFHAAERDGFYHYDMELADPAPRTEISNAYFPYTLKHVIDNEAPIPATRALQIIECIVEALRYLHSNNKIHRDVKPSNILFVRGKAKLGDLGLVTSLDRDVTVIGTPGYLPLDGPADKAADLYATGVVLYELITGLHRDQFPDLPITRPRDKQELSAFIAANQIAVQAANKDKSKRFKSAEEMLACIRERRVTNVGRRAHWIISAACFAVLAALGVALKKPLVLDSMPSRPIQVSAPAGPGYTELRTVRLTAANGQVQEMTFPCIVQNPLLGRFWPDRPLMALGYTSSADCVGRLLVLDAAQFFSKASPKTVWEQMICNTPPAAWSFQEPSTICHLKPLLIGDFDSEQGNELVVVSEHDDGTSQILILGNGGRSLGCYWHYGWTSGVSAADVNADGEKELVCWGIANWRPDPSHLGRYSEPLRACIFVLTVEALRLGSGYWGSNEWLTGGSGAAPLAYGYLIPGPSKMANEWLWEGCDIFAGANKQTVTIRMRLKSGLYVDFDGDLTLKRTGFNNSSGHDGEIPPSITKNWHRTWPPLEKSP